MKNVGQKNTLLNYFSSPSNPKPTTPQSTPKSATATTPKSTKGQRDKGLTPSKAGNSSKTPSNSATPKSHKEKATGKENKATLDKKRSIDELDDDDEEVIGTPKPKKRRIIIPEESDCDSEDEFKPDPNETISDDNASEGVSEDEPETDSDDETPKKKARISKKPSARGKTPKKVESKPSGQEVKPKVDHQSWPHLKYDFLQPGKIKDINKRSPDHPDYDPNTLFVPDTFLAQQTPAQRQWWELKRKNFQCVLFFKLGKFYELYHMDSVIGVNELNLTYMRGELAHSGFPEIAYGRFSASLIERGYKVARVEQTETPEMNTERCRTMGKTSKFDKVVKREICQISTKGTVVQSVQDADAAVPTSRYLLSLIEQKTTDKPTSTYGVCFIDTTIGEFYLGQFTDDRCNSRLLTLLAHYPPVHVIYERGNLSATTMKIINTYLPGALKEALQKEGQFWSSAKVLKHLHEEEYFKKNNEFSWPDGLQPHLNLGDSLGLSASQDSELAVNALGGCVYLLRDYLLDQQLLSQGRFKSYTPPDFSNTSNAGTKLANCMVLDAMTINNLKILGGEGSLVKRLDRCATAFGKRLLHEWICRPSCRKDTIFARQEAIMELVERPDIAQSVRSKLCKLPDLERLLSKIHANGNAARLYNHPDGRAIKFDEKVYSKKKIQEFISALEGFEQLLDIIKEFDECSNKLIQSCSHLEPEGEFPDLQETLDFFKQAFDHEEAKKEGSIKPKSGVDEEYDAVMKELKENEKEQEAYLEKQRRHFGVKVKYIGKTDKKRFQLEVPDSQVKKVGSGFELQSQRKGFKRYYTAEARELLQNQISTEERKSKVLKDLNRRIFAQFSEKYDMWSKAVYKIATLDVLLSLAEYARDEPTCVPEINDDTNNDGKIFIEIRDGKHPCVQSDTFIPNDTLVATGDAASLMILTGPNMGGKSTLMRQVGLIIVMAQMGCPVPASSCRLTLVDRIFTRIGANDDIMTGQSTFLVELSETSSILQHATPYSLVLMDELGRGTSTYDGTAIAAAVVNALTKIKCRTLFSTHYHSLVEDYKIDPNVTLAHMACMVESDDKELSEEKVTFLYKLSAGACPKSYGFNAARLAGVPLEVIKKAQKVATELEGEVKRRHAFALLCKKDSSDVNEIADLLKEL